MSVATKMTAIADKIRSLLGISGAMGLDAMATNLSEVESEVGNQADLISQIASALEGKAAGSGGAVETCSVTLVYNISWTSSITNVKFGYINYINGIYGYEEQQISSGSMTIENVVCNSYFKPYEDGISLSVESEDGTSSLFWGQVIVGTSNTTITISE